MKFQWKPPEAEQLWKLLDKYKYVLLALAAVITMIFLAMLMKGMSGPKMR